MTCMGKRLSKVATMYLGLTFASMLSFRLLLQIDLFFFVFKTNFCLKNVSSRIFFLLIFFLVKGYAFVTMVTRKDAKLFSAHHLKHANHFKSVAHVVNLFAWTMRCPEIQKKHPILVYD